MGYRPGESGNPGGRPRKSEEQRRFEQRCREWADTLGFDKLKRWADSDEAGKSLEALKEIFNRGFGKPTEFVEANVTQDTGGSVEDLAREVAELIGEREAKGGAGDSPAPVDGGQ